MEAAILYGMDDFLYELITFPDGLLTIALGWLFEQAGVEWRYSIPVPGGVLIKSAAGEVLGAVGISGDTSEKDEACAIAGIDAAGLKAATGA